MDKILGFFSKLFWWINLVLAFLVVDYFVSEVKQEVKEGKTSKAKIVLIIILYLAIFIGFNILCFNSFFK